MITAHLMVSTEVCILKFGIKRRILLANNVTHGFHQVNNIFCVFDKKVTLRDVIALILTIWTMTYETR